MKLTRRKVLIAGLAGVASTSGIVACMNDGGTNEEPHPFASEARRNRKKLEDFRFDNSAGHDRVVVYDANRKKVATLTEGARTVNFHGPVRTFAEPGNTRAVITTDVWARLAPQAWYTGAQEEDWFADWFLKLKDSEDDDILSIAMQYLDGKPLLRDAKGVPYAGDAGFGLVRTSDTVDGADFYDYLGISWKWPDGSTARPSKRWYRRLDCSGYLRLVYGYRSGIELLSGAEYPGSGGLPRTARAMASYAAGVLVAKGAGPSDNPGRSALAGALPGDAVFFALHRNLSFISHSGIYIGDDNKGHMRFLSSRTSINGPTFGDFATRSVFDEGFFNSRLRRIVRF